MLFSMQLPHIVRDRGREWKNEKWQSWLWWWLLRELREWPAVRWCEKGEGDRKGNELAGVISPNMWC